MTESEGKISDRGLDESRGLRFSCNDRADKVNKLFIQYLAFWGFSLREHNKKTPEFSTFACARKRSFEVVVNKYLYVSIFLTMVGNI